MSPEWQVVAVRLSAVDHAGWAETFSWRSCEGYIARRLWSRDVSLS